MKFTVEFGDATNGTQYIKTLKIKVRGHYANAKLKRAANIGALMAAMPVIPGVKMDVDTSTGKVRVYDPLEGKPDIIPEINAVREQALSIKSSGQVVTFVPATDHELDADGIKTLLMELVNKKTSNCIRVTAGIFPSDDVIAKLPGRQLTFGTNGRRPKYVDMMEDYERQLEKV